MSKEEHRIIHLHIAAPAKPTIGEPCNGCGVCCALETCPLARLRFLKRDGPCPALAWSESEQRYRCDLMATPGRHFPWLPAAAIPTAGRLIRRWIAAGVGCDCETSPDDTRT